MLEKIKEIIKNQLDKTDFKKIADDNKKEAEHWEFKYNKLNRQLRAILKESSN